MAVCQICKIRPAKIHYTEIVNNQTVRLDLCPECAADKGIDVQKPGPHGLGDLVAGLIDTTAAEGEQKIGKVACPSCGYEYSEFRKIGRFGCPDCYDAFEAQIEPMLRQLHGSTRHGGKQPSSGDPRVSRRRRLTELREELTRAVKEENYERAAEIRDEIAELESEGSRTSEGEGE